MAKILGDCNCSLTEGPDQTETVNKVLSFQPAELPSSSSISQVKGTIVLFR